LSVGRERETCAIRPAQADGRRLLARAQRGCGVRSRSNDVRRPAGHAGCHGRPTALPQAGFSFFPVRASREERDPARHVFPVAGREAWILAKLGQPEVAMSVRSVLRGRNVRADPTISRTCPYRWTWPEACSSMECGRDRARPGDRGGAGWAS
jgi:hypothetical protein